MESEEILPNIFVRSVLPSTRIGAIKTGGYLKFAGQPVQLH